VNNFEENVAAIARENGYKYVVCGHIHQPAIKVFSDLEGKGEVTYLNSGDWVENHTSLEYVNGKWSIYQYKETKEIHPEAELKPINIDLSMILEEQVMS
jgi:UDP-2,3-diacylglucosamine pyrophosphatase LpxH